MLFRRKIALRIQLASLIPIVVTVLVGFLLTLTGLAPSESPRFYFGQLFVLIPALLLGWLLTHQITKRLRQLRRSAEQIERGDLQTRVPTSSEIDEFADLARAFNHMADMVAAREMALRDQNQTQAALNDRLESVLNATHDGIALLDQSGSFVLVNRRFSEMLGLRESQILHQPIDQLQSPLFSNRFAALLAEERGEITTPDRRFLQLYTAPVLGHGGNAQIGRIVALRDVTRERELDQMKNDFISVVSHELRTPLTSIKGYTDLLVSGQAGETTDLQREFLGIIQNSTTQLSSLINDILDISKIESGKMEVKSEPIDYRQIMGSVLRMVKPAADQKRIAIDVLCPDTVPTLCGDAEKITQILTNLVSNSIKYTMDGGWIKISLEVSAGEGLTTCVSDNGIGISPDDQKKLFRRFFRADNSSTREAGGTGLGLVICKTLVELLGGAIWVDSALGCGSRFYFTLPLSRERVEELPFPLK